MLAEGSALAQESGLIHFRCTAPSHQQGVEGRTADTITVHEGKWSYCPKDIRETGHEWQPTGGVQIQLLRRGSPTINLDLDVRPHLGSKISSTPAGQVTTAAPGNGGTPRRRTTPTKR